MTDFTGTFNDSSDVLSEITMQRMVRTIAELGEPQKEPRIKFIYSPWIEYDDNKVYVMESNKFNWVWEREPMPDAIVVLPYPEDIGL